MRPYGKNYIAHDDIPPEVQAAFERLQAVYGTQTRAANPLYASKWPLNILADCCIILNILD